MDIFSLNKLVINLPERNDRLIQFDKEFKKLFDDNYIVVDGVKHNDSRVGVMLAHKKCIQIAIQNNWDNVLIMEDDLKFTNEHLLKDYVTNAFKIPPTNYNLLLGGLYTSGNLNVYNEYWNKTTEFSGLHFYIVNKNCYNRILECPEHLHIDRFMAHHKYGKLNCYVVDKFFAIQYSGYSNNRNMEMNYDNLLDKFKLL